MLKESEPARNTYDTVFQLFFKDDKKSFIDLYEALSGKRLKEDDIKPYSLQSDSIVKPLNNDVSYLTTDNRLIILVEHQSTPNNNMPAREFLYYAALMGEWAADNDKKLSTNKEIDLPMPEFYVAYNGKEPFNKETLSFKNDFISVKCKLLDINLDKLQDLYKNKDKNNALYGYAYFTHHFKKKTEELNSQGITGKEASKRAYIYAQQKCIDNGITPDIMKRRDMMLVVDIMSREDELRFEGEERGIKIGEQRGRQEGRQEGIKDRLDMLKYIREPATKNTLFKQIKEDALSIGVSLEDFEQMKIKAGLGTKPQNLSKNNGERTLQSKETKTETKQSFKERMAEAKEAKEIHNNNLSSETKKPTNREGR